MNKSLTKIKALIFETYGLLYFKLVNLTDDDRSTGLSLEEALEMYQQGVTFVDARKPAEWRRGSIKRALFASGAEFDQVSPKPAHDDVLVTFCEAGDRAKNAAQKLREQGYINVYYLRGGGFASWANAGYPVAA